MSNVVKMQKAAERERERKIEAALSEHKQLDRFLEIVQRANDCIDELQADHGMPDTAVEAALGALKRGRQLLLSRYVMSAIANFGVAPAEAETERASSPESSQDESVLSDKADAIGTSFTEALAAIATEDQHADAALPESSDEQEFPPLTTDFQGN